jgi:hypothetical protein
VGTTVVGIAVGAWPSAIAIFEKPMNSATPALSSTSSAGVNSSFSAWASSASGGPSAARNASV